MFAHLLQRLRTKWRKYFRAIHRDLGYFVVALTLAYSISGLAVNHLDDWNPNYKLSSASIAIGALPRDSLQAMEQHVLAQTGIDRREVRGHFQENDREFRVFLVDGGEVRVNIADGAGTIKRLARRKVFFEVNSLHLNNLKGAWTYIADAFAVILILLAITGLTMMKGDRGLWGRGKWFVLAGLAVPVGAIVYMYW